MEKFHLNEQAASQIRECLRKKGMTQELFAEVHLKTTFRTLQNWLSGKTPVGIEKLDIIQRYCCVSLENLFGNIPNGYSPSVGGIVPLLRRILDVDFLLAIRKYYQSYIDWLLACVHFSPYPINGYFDVLEHNAKIAKNFYNEFSVCIKSKETPVDSEIVIGYILLIGRIRIDYGWMRVKEDYIEVREAFTQSSIVYYVPINLSDVRETGVLFNIITWFGEESCTFVIRSSTEDFFIENLGEIKMSQSDVLNAKFKNKVVFQKCIGHHLNS